MPEPATCPACGAGKPMNITDMGAPIPTWLCVKCGMVWAPSEVVCDVAKEREDDNE